MRKAVFITVMLFSGALRLGAQDVTPAEFDNYVWDFGKINETDGEVSHTFEFTNRSGAAMVIVSVSSTCNCAVPDYDKDPIEPGAKSYITVKLDPRGMSGDFDKRLAVTFSADGNDYINIYVRGRVIPREKTAADAYKYIVGEGLQLENEVLYFGNVEQGSAAEARIGYINNSGRPVTLSLSITEGENIFRVSQSEVFLAPQEEGAITVECDLTRLNAWAIIQGEVSFTVNGRLLPYKLKLSAKGTGKLSVNETTGEAPQARLDPSFKYFTGVRVGTTNDFTVTLFNDGKMPLKVYATKTDEGLKCNLINGKQISPGKNTSFRIEISYPTQAPSERLVHSLYIVTNDPANPVISLRVLSSMGE